MRLSTEQLDSFEKQGFLVLENFVSARQCENLRPVSYTHLTLPTKLTV